MASTQLKLDHRAPLNNGRMIMGFSGWMDGGEVSTGTVEVLVESLGAEAVGEIDPDDFYIYSLPGPMEFTALFRPHGKIEDGLVTEFVTPENQFWCAPEQNLVLFSGKEPNLHWRDYADCVFEVAERLHITSICFVGSVAGLTTHTREPRIMCGASSEKLRDEMKSFGVRMSNYEGPVSMVTYLMTEAPRREIEMLLFVAEIPAYVEGHNPKCIEAMTRLLARYMELPIELDPMRVKSDAWENRVSQAVNDQEELATQVRKLEKAYDDEVFDTQMDDLKAYLKQRGVRLD
jgi:predicted ATP-grasp superfamily ATP-dependent carboligase